MNHTRPRHEHSGLGYLAALLTTAALVTACQSAGGASPSVTVAPSPTAQTAPSPGCHGHARATRHGLRPAHGRRSCS